MHAHRKILIVEDDLYTRRIIERILTRDAVLQEHRVEVISAGDGEEGLLAFREHKPHLVITDLLMPRLDGFQLVERISAESEENDPCVIVMSAVFGEHAALKQLQSKHGAVFQPKPFNTEGFVALVRRMMELEPSDQPSPVSEATAFDAGPPTDVASAETRPASSPGWEKSSTRDPRKSVPSAASDSESAGAEASARQDSRVPARRGVGSVVLAAALGATGKASDEENHGDLAEISLPRILLDALEQQWVGTLDLRRGRVRKVVSLQGGYPIFVQSNLRAETLGQLLMRRRRLTVAEHEAVLNEASRQAIRYGEALVSLGILDEAQVMGELLIQTHLKLQNALRWPDGEWGFRHDPSAGKRVPNCTLDPLDVVFEGLRRTFDLEQAMARYGREETLGGELALASHFERYRSRFVALFGDELVTAAVADGAIAESLPKLRSTRLLLQLDVLLSCGLAILTPAPAVREEPSHGWSQSAWSLRGLVGPAMVTAESSVSEPTGKQRGRREAVRDGRTMERRERARVGARQKRFAKSPSSAVSTTQRVAVARQLIQSTYLGLHTKDHYAVLGVIPSTDGNGVEVAYRIKRSQFDLECFRGMDLGEDYQRLEEIITRLDEAFAVLSNPESRREFDGSQRDELERRRVAALEAERSFGEGLAHLAKLRHEEAAQAFGRAVELDEQVEYACYRALARFKAAGSTSEAAADALRHLDRAIAADPAQTVGYRLAASIHRSLGSPEDAASRLRQALRADPTDAASFDQLEALLLGQGKLGALEEQYRRVIHLLGDRSARWVAALWKRLVLLYRDRLHDLEKARLAARAALKLNPNDAMLQSLLHDEDGCGQRGTWPQAVVGYRVRLRGNPDDGDALRMLYRLHRSAGRLDAAFIAASAAILQGQADEELQGFYRRYRPPAPLTTTLTMADRIWYRLQDDPDGAQVSALFVQLAPLMEQVHGESSSGISHAAPSRAVHHELSVEESAVVCYVARNFGIPVPSFFEDPSLGDEVVALATRPPALLVGPAALGSHDPYARLFRLAYALALLGEGRRAIVFHSEPVLRRAAMAAVAAAQWPSRPRYRPSGSLQREVETELFRELYRALVTDSDRLRAVGTMVSAIGSGELEDLDYSALRRGVVRTAQRAALLFATDLVTACSLVGGHGFQACDPVQWTKARPYSEASQASDLVDQRALSHRHDLVDFALSQPYADLRAEFGLAISLKDHATR